MRVRDITTGMPFTFDDDPNKKIFISRGNGWYASPMGYDGGPYTNDTSTVSPAPTNLHSKSFLGLPDTDVLAMHAELANCPTTIPGDMALLIAEISNRGLTITPVTGPMRPMTVREYHDR